VCDAGFRVWGLGVRAQGSGFWVLGVGCGVQGSACRRGTCVAYEVQDPLAVQGFYLTQCINQMVSLKSIPPQTRQLN